MTRSPLATSPVWLALALALNGSLAVAGALGPLEFSAPADTFPDIYRLRLNAGVIEIVDELAVTVVASRPLADTDAVTISGEAFHPDTFIIDFTGGNPVPPLGVSVDGGDLSSGDGLELEGGDFDTVEHVFPQPPSGEVLLGSGSVLLDSSLITYSGLRLTSIPLVDRVPAANRVFTPQFLSTKASWRLGDDQQGDPGFSGLRFGFGVQDTVRFASPSSSLTLNLRDEFDDVTIRPFEAGVGAAVNVNGGSGPDELRLFDGDLSAGTDMGIALIDAATGEADVSGLVFPLTVRGVEIVLLNIVGTGTLEVTGTSGADAVTLMEGPYYPERLFFNGSPPLNPGSAGGTNGPDFELGRFDLITLDGADPLAAPGDAFHHLGTAMLTGTPASGSVEGAGSDVFFRNFESAEIGLPAIFVDRNAPPGGDGRTWASAFDTVQEGITASAPGPLPVWVADGVYPETVTMGDSVRLLGGFTGLRDDEESFEDERDPSANVTVLDGGGAGPVVLFDGVEGARIDGFTVTAGFASEGAGVLIRQGGRVHSNVVEGCAVIDNLADGGPGGGLIVTDGGEAFVIDSQFTGNTAPGFVLGGGVAVDGGSRLTLAGCLLAANSAFGGGGLGVRDGSEAFVRRTVLSGNIAVAGGGIFEDGSSTRATSCLISGNRATFRGGGVRAQDTNSSDYVNCTIARNAAGDGGGMSLDQGARPDLVNNIYEGNSPLAIKEESLDDDPAVSFCLFENNVVGDYLDIDTSQLLVGDSVNSLIGNSDNFAGDPDFRAGLTGTWVPAAPIYDAASNRTTLRAASPMLEPGSLVGSIINPDTGQLLETAITGNSAVTIEVVGDFVAGPLSLVGGETFAIADYRLGIMSAGIDTGTTILSSASDLEEVPRPYGAGYDVGAYEAHPELSLSDEEIVFADRDIDDGPSPATALTLTNTGIFTLFFMDITLTSPTAGEFSLAETPSTQPLEPGASRDLQIIFDPSLSFLRLGTLTLLTEDPREPPFGRQVPLRGRGIDQEISLLSASAEALDTDIDDLPSQLHVRIANVGTNDLSFTAAPDIMGPDAAAFTVAGDPASVSVAPATERILRVQFDPERLGPHTADLRIQTDDTNESTVLVPIGGRGFVSTPNLVARLLGAMGLPIALDETDVNEDGAADSADVVTNVNHGL